MSAPTVSAAAVATREAHRHGDGQFGTQPHQDSGMVQATAVFDGLPITCPATVAMPDGTAHAGCGSTNATGPDPDGLYRCACGTTFNDDEIRNDRRYGPNAIITPQLAPGIPADAHVLGTSRQGSNYTYDPEAVTCAGHKHIGGGVWAIRSPHTGELFLSGSTTNSEYLGHQIEHGMPYAGMLGQVGDQALADYTARFTAEIDADPITAAGTSPRVRNRLIKDATEEHLVHCEDLLITAVKLGGELPGHGNNIYRHRIKKTRARIAAGGHMSIYTPDKEEASA